MFMPEQRKLRLELCVNCRGRGNNPKKRGKLCPECGGSGNSTICRDCGKDTNLMTDEGCNCRGKDKSWIIYD